MLLAGAQRKVDDLTKELAAEKARDSIDARRASSEEKDVSALVVQCVAACCSVVQCVAVWCSVLN